MMKNAKILRITLGPYFLTDKLERGPFPGGSKS